MIRRKFFHHFHTCRPQGIHLGQGIYTLVRQHFDKFDKYPCGTLCVVHCAMMIFQRNIQGLGHCVQSVFGLVRKQHPCDAHRIHIGKHLSGHFFLLSHRPIAALRCLRHKASRLCRQSKAPDIFNDKTHVKPCVMSHQNAPPGKGKKLWHHLFNTGSILNHVILNACKLFNLKGNRHLRIDKGGETFCDLSSTDFHRSNFYDTIIHRRKTSCLYVKNDKVFLQLLSFVPCDNFFQIIHQIGFHPIYHFEKVLLIGAFVPCFQAFLLLLAPQVIPYMIGVRISLHHTMIRYGYGPVAPLVGAFYNVLHFGHPVHITHFGMTMKLHSLMRRSVHTGRGKIRRLLNPHKGPYGNLMVKFIQGCHSLDFHKSTRFQVPHQFFYKFIF